MSAPALCPERWSDEGHAHCCIRSQGHGGRCVCVCGQERSWQHGQDPEKYSRWLLKDGREVTVIGVDWLLSIGKEIALQIDKVPPTLFRRSGVVYMSKAGFWKRVEKPL